MTAGAHRSKCGALSCTATAKRSCSIMSRNRPGPSGVLQKAKPAQWRSHVRLWSCFRGSEKRCASISSFSLSIVSIAGPHCTTWALLSGTRCACHVQDKRESRGTPMRVGADAVAPAQRAMKGCGTAGADTGLPVVRCTMSGASPCKRLGANMLQAPHNALAGDAKLLLSCPRKPVSNAHAGCTKMPASLQTPCIQQKAKLQTFGTKQRTCCVRM